MLLFLPTSIVIRGEKIEYPRRIITINTLAENPLISNTNPTLQTFGTNHSEELSTGTCVMLKIGKRFILTVSNS